MTILYFLLACMLALVVCSVRIGASVNYNILQNLGHVRLSIFYLPIFSRDISFYGKYLAVNKECKHALQIKIEIDKPSIQFAKDITKVIKSKIYLSAINMESHIGFNSRADITALVSGYVVSLFSIMQTTILSHDKAVLCNCTVKQNYADNELKLTINAVVYFSLYDIIWAIVVGIYKRRKYIYGQRY